MVNLLSLRRRVVTHLRAMVLLTGRKLALVESLLHHGLLTLTLRAAACRRARLRAKEVVVDRLSSVHLLPREVLALLLQLRANISRDMRHLVWALDHLLEVLFVACVNCLRQVLRLGLHNSHASVTLIPDLRVL